MMPSSLLSRSGWIRAVCGHDIGAATQGQVEPGQRCFQVTPSCLLVPLAGSCQDSHRPEPDAAPLAMISPLVLRPRSRPARNELELRPAEVLLRAQPILFGPRPADGGGGALAEQSSDQVLQHSI